MTRNELKINLIKTINQILNIYGIETREVIVNNKNDIIIKCDEFRIKTNYVCNYFYMYIYDKTYKTFTVLNDISFIINEYNKELIIKGGDVNEL